MKKYQITIQVKDASPQNLAMVAPLVGKTLSGLSRSAPELCFRSKLGDLFGYVITSEKNAGQIRAAIEAPGPRFKIGDGPILSGDDKLMVVELGNDFSCGVGYTRFGVWFQRRTLEAQGQ